MIHSTRPCVTLYAYSGYEIYSTYGFVCKYTDKAFCTSFTAYTKKCITQTIYNINTSVLSYSYSTVHYFVLLVLCKVATPSKSGKV